MPQQVFPCLYHLYCIGKIPMKSMRNRYLSHLLFICLFWTFFFTQTSTQFREAQSLMKALCRTLWYLNKMKNLQDLEGSTSTTKDLQSKFPYLTMAMASACPASDTTTKPPAFKRYANLCYSSHYLRNLFTYSSVHCW